MRLSSRFFFLFILCAGSILIARAQVTTKSIELKPIGKSGWNYIYGVNPVKNGWSLQIPIQGLNDPEVNKYFNSFVTLQRSRGLAYLPGLVANITAIITNDENLYYSSILILMAGIPVDLTLCAISHRKMGKAIDLYNIAIAKHSSLGMQMEKTNLNQTLISFGIRQRF